MTRALRNLRLCLATGAAATVAAAACSLLVDGVTAKRWTWAVAAVVVAVAAGAWWGWREGRGGSS